MKKLKGFIFWAGIFIILITTVVSNSLSNLDEIWNFNFARCISNGLVPYRDISMIPTPLLGFLVAPFLKIFGEELFVTRIMSVILFFITLILVYNILRKLDVSKVISKVSIIFVLFLQLEYVDLNYNYFSLFIELLIILFELRCLRKKKGTSVENIFIGLLGGLSVCRKQTIGILICGVILLNPLFFITGKKDIKKTIKQIVLRFIGIAIPVIGFIAYLLVNNAYYDFVDYSINGVKTFTNRISYENLMKAENAYKVLCISMPIILICSIIFNIIMKFKKKEHRNLSIMTVYAIPIFALVYPIADKSHFVIAIVPIIMLFVFELSQLIKKCINKKIVKKYISEFIEVITMLGIIASALYCVIQYNEVLGNLSKYKLINHFNYINISDNVYKSITTVDDYINSSEKKVYIIDATAAAYMIPLDRYNKNYDMFLIGNLGSGSEEQQIENIKNEDAKYLILKDEIKRNWQNPEQVRLYIKDNMRYIESVGDFDVYENIPNESEQNDNAIIENDENIENNETQENENPENEIQDNEIQENQDLQSSQETQDNNNGEE